MNNKLTIHALKRACRTSEFKNLFSESERSIFNNWIENQRCSSCWNELVNIFIENKSKLDEYFKTDTSHVINYNKKTMKVKTRTFICACEELESKMREVFGCVRVSSSIAMSRHENQIFILVHSVNETSPCADIIVVNTSADNVQKDTENINKLYDGMKIFYSAMFKDKITIMCLLF